ncbi:flagellar protein FlaG [Methylobacillus pratensis]|uniref:flagellar protein FlaG n=1 Tax=Methylobacillus sp. Pita1 TaxID=3382642 RepID=UPI0038B64960
MAITNIEAYSQAGSLASTVRNAGPAVSLPGAGSKEAEQQASVASDADVQSAVEQINEFISPIMQSIQFSTDADSGRVVVKVVDSETQKVLRQIPNEEVLAISKTLDKLQGLIIRQTA